MGFLERLLKGTGKFVTTPGRDLAQMIRLVGDANKVKRVEAPSFTNEDLQAIADLGGSEIFNQLPQNKRFQEELGQSQEAYRGLQSEMENPTANKFLNEKLGVTDREQERQQADQLLTPATAVKNALIGGSIAFPGAESLLGAIGAGAASSSMGAAGYAPQGEEAISALIAAPIGAAGGAVGYGLSKLGQNIFGKPKVKSYKPASDQATKDLGLGSKEIEKLGGWQKAREFATQFYDDAQQMGLDTKDRYARSQALDAIKNTLDADVERALARAGSEAVNADDLFDGLSSDRVLGALGAEDNKTYLGLVDMIRGAADADGNINPIELKGLIKDVDSIAGGFDRAVGTQTPKTNQIISKLRGSMRDALAKIAPEASGLLNKWSDYITVSPAVGSKNVAGSAGLTVPGAGPLTGKVSGTGAGKVSDWFSNLLSSQGSMPSIEPRGGAIPAGMEALQQAIPSLQGVLGGLTGGGALQQPEQQQVSEFEGDDYINQLRGKYFEPQQEQAQGMTSSGLGMEEASAIKQLLTIEMLQGNISSAEASAVVSLLGLDQEEEENKLTSSAKNRLYELKTAESDLLALQELISSYEGASGPVAGGIAKRLPGTEARKINSEFSRITQSIATSLEGGKLSDRDREFYKTITPQVDDTKVERDYKIDSLLSSIRRNSATFEDVYGEGSNEIGALESMLGL